MGYGNLQLISTLFELYPFLCSHLQTYIFCRMKTAQGATKVWLSLLS